MFWFFKMFLQSRCVSFLLWCFFKLVFFEASRCNIGIPLVFIVECKRKCINFLLLTVTDELFHPFGCSCFLILNVWKNFGDRIGCSFIFWWYTNILNHESKKFLHFCLVNMYTVLKRVYKLHCIKQRLL